MVFTIPSGCNSRIDFPDVGFSAHKFVKEGAEDVLEYSVFLNCQINLGIGGVESCNKRILFVMIRRSRCKSIDGASID